MSSAEKSQAELLQEAADLRARLEEADETLRAIRSGEVDALVMGEDVYTLKGAETPYRLLIESMNEGAATLIPDGTITYCNRRFADMLATPTEQVIGSCLWQCVVPAEQPILRSLVATAQQAAARAELTFSGPGGPGLPVLLSLRPIQMDSNTIGVVAADLSERKRAEQALRQANESLEQRVIERTEELRQQHEWLSVTLSSIGDALIATDAAGRITFLNPVAETLTGWSRAEVLGQPVQSVFQILDETTRVPGEDIIERVLREGAIIKLANNTCLIARGGREVPIEDSAAPIRDSVGGVAGAVLVFHDVTDKRRAMSAVREEKDRLASLLASITDEVWFADTNKKFTLANPAALREFGLDPAEGIGVEELAARLEVLRPDGSSRPVEEAPPLRALQGEIVRDLDETTRTPASGELRYRQVSAAPVRDAHGVIIGSVSVVRDITARKQADKALLRLSRRDAFLVALADALRPLSNVNEIKTAAARLLGQHLRASRVAYAEVTPEGDMITEPGYADGVPDLPGRYRLDDYGPALLPDIRAGRNIVVADVANAPCYTEQKKARYVAVQVAANLNVPRLKNGRLVALCCPPGRAAPVDG